MVITDHMRLKHTSDKSTVVSDRSSAQLQRWAYIIRSFDFNVATITSEHMLLANTLSRLPNDVDEMEIENGNGKY